MDDEVGGGGGGGGLVNAEMLGVWLSYEWPVGNCNVLG